MSSSTRTLAAADGARRRRRRRSLAVVSGAAGSAPRTAARRARAAAARGGRRRRLGGAPAAARAVARRARPLRPRRARSRRPGSTSRSPRSRSRRRSCSAALCFRGERVAAGPWRDYVTLTKPRIMSLLLLTGAGGMFVGAQGVPPLGLFAATMAGLALACGGASALNHVLDARHRPADGRAHREAPGRRGPRPAAARARVRARALGALVRAAREHGERADRGARARRQPLLRRRLHALAEALDAAEHRHRRRRRRGAAARRLRGRDAATWPAGALALPDRLPLDAAALLGARAADQGELRGREGADAAGRARRAETTRQIVLYSVVLVAFTLAVGFWLGARLPGRGARPRRRFLGWRGSSGGSRRGGPASSSTTRSSTSRCSSSRRRSTRCS